MTRAERRRLARGSVLVDHAVPVTPRWISGCACRSASAAAFLSPLAIAASTFFTKVLMRLVRARLTAVRLDLARAFRPTCGWPWSLDARLEDMPRSGPDKPEPAGGADIDSGDGGQAPWPRWRLSGCGSSARASRRRRPCLPSGPRWRRRRGTGRRSKRTPSASVVSKARLTDSLAISTTGREKEAIFWAAFTASSTSSSARHHAADQPGALGLRRIHHAAGQHPSPSPWTCPPARQALRAARAGHDAELDLGLAELRVLGGDDEVAHHGQLAAAAQRVAGHRRDHRLAALRGCAPSPW